MPQPKPFNREWSQIPSPKGDDARHAIPLLRERGIFPRNFYEAIDDLCGDGNPACDDEEDLIDPALLDKIRPRGVRLRKFEEEL